MRGMFDIVGPVMIGPSSSHTAGAVRLGLMAGKILGEQPVKAEIKLHGSFAQTYRGHGTDRALIAGILGFQPDDERIRNSMDIARERGMDFSFSKVEIFEAHPNTAIIELTGVSGRRTVVTGASIGGGNINILNIDGFEVNLSGQYPAMLVIHRDVPGVINKVTWALSRFEINIAFMRLSRKSRGEEALMLLETDENVPEEVVEECKQVHNVSDVFTVPSI
ncbi:MAG: L-serine ammonia-lyase, iron-sulfur-dependent subunit beta [Selenomonadales bacterium]|nr:L-serine ammonia-lyase, iron-sulfur-dependent subunit beta [Selenomonadales bacterium]MDD6218763.1 L-serine ammonia-lyase, iron-sulfur-dependent subunit beta [Selenomonadaceae bacterium]